MAELVVVYAPGALVGIPLQQSCSCSCHDGEGMHFVACCEAVPGFVAFPELDGNGVPIAKLPDCPNCGEDELGVIDVEQVLCYRCGWQLVRGNRIGVHS